MNEAVKARIAGCELTTSARITFIFSFIIREPYKQLNNLDRSVVTGKSQTSNRTPAARSSDFVITRIIINNGNRTEWSPIRSVIIRVITKSDSRCAVVRFVNHGYDYRSNWTTRTLYPLPHLFD